MTKAVWISDLHYAETGEILGYDPRARLARAVEHIEAHHSDAACCLITGDLVNRGRPEDYSGLRQQLDRLSIPYYPMMGNHDDRSLLRSHLPLPSDCMGDFIQYQVEMEDAVFLCLDTHKTGSDAGEFCNERLDWLSGRLEEAGSKPVYLFFHHPPMKLGLPMQDTERMEDGEGFLDLVRRFPNVAHLCMGHVHRPITGTVATIPFTTLRSLLYQAPAPKPDWTWDSFQPASEAPCMGILGFEHGQFTLQFDEFCTAEFGG